MTDISPILKKTEFKAFADVLQRGGIIKAIQVDKDLSRKDLDNLNEFARGLGGKGLSWVKVSPEGWPHVRRALAKFLRRGEDGPGQGMTPTRQ
jgi:aspartyl-tRNA synthetase